MNQAATNQAMSANDSQFEPATSSEDTLEKFRNVRFDQRSATLKVAALIPVVTWLFYALSLLGYMLGADAFAFLAGMLMMPCASMGGFASIGLAMMVIVGSLAAANSDGGTNADLKQALAGTGVILFTVATFYAMTIMAFSGWPID